MEYTKKELLEMLSVAEKKNPVIKISSPSDVSTILITKYGKRKVESFFVVTLNASHHIVRVKEVTKGILNRAIVHPREVFYEAIKDRAASIVIAHNHPSSNIQPSSEDRSLTMRLEEAGKLMGIEVLDHIVFTDTSYYSFLEEGEF